MVGVVLRGDESRQGDGGDHGGGIRGGERRRCGGRMVVLRGGESGMDGGDGDG